MIPTDIVDHVLSILHSDQDYPTLETCSFVFPFLADRYLSRKALVLSSLLCTFLRAHVAHVLHPPITSNSEI